MERSKELGKRILACIGAVIFLLSMTMLVTSITANAASAETSKAVKSVRVQADNKNVTKKTSTLEIGKSKSLKVIASPKRAVKSIRYQSSKPQIAAVNKSGKVTAKRKGAATIRITVSGKNNKKKTTWTKIKVTEPKASPKPNPQPNPQPNP